MPALQRFQKTKMRMAFVERAIKRAAHYVALVKRGQRLDMFPAKLGVCVLKQ